MTIVICACCYRDDGGKTTLVKHPRHGYIYVCHACMDCAPKGCIRTPKEATDV